MRGGDGFGIRDAFDIDTITSDDIRILVGNIASSNDFSARSIYNVLSKVGITDGHLRGIDIDAELKMVSAVDDSVVLPDGGERGEADDYGRSADGGESQKSAGQANRIWNDGIETFTTPSSVGVQVQGRHLAANGRFLRRYDGGGEVPDSTRTPSSRVAALVQRINETSNADFVRRLLGRNRKTLDNGDGTVSTHELGYVTDADGNATVFPQVQSADYGNLLMRVPYPMSYDRAVERGDTVRMSVPDAEAFTSWYKNFYPGFGEYACGGLLRRYEEGGHKPVGAAGGEIQSVTPISFDWNGVLPGSLYIPQSVPDYTPVPYSANGYALERAERNEAREPAAAATATDTSRVIHLSPAQARAALKQINQRNSEIAGEDTAEGMQPAASTRVDSHIEPVLQSIDFSKAPEAHALNARVFGASERRAVAAAVGQLQSGDELKDFQRLLAEQGYYKNLKTPEIKVKTKDEVKELQRMLKEYGYDIGATGENKDGIDGIVGQRTRAAFAKYAAEHPSEELINSVADGKLGSATRRAAAAYFRDVVSGKVNPYDSRYSYTPGIALAMYHNISDWDKTMNMFGTVLPSHIGAAENKARNAVKGLVTGTDYDAMLADAVEDTKAVLAQARAGGDPDAIAAAEQNYKDAVARLPKNVLNRKGLSDAEIQTVLAALTSLNGDRLMTYDDYLKNIQAIGGSDGDFLGANPKHKHKKTGATISLYNGRSVYNLMNDFEDSQGGVKDGETSNNIVSSLVNAEKRIYNDPQRGRLGSFSYFIDFDNNIHIVDALSATERKAARGKNDNQSYNRSRDFFPRASTAPIEYVIPADVYLEYISAAQNQM